jgi:hypothetical protein
MRLRDHLGISTAWQRRLSRAMELALIGILIVGVYNGSTGVVVNTGVAIAVTQLPALLERDYEIELDPALTLWLTAAVFLRALGTVGIP